MFSVKKTLIDSMVTKQLMYRHCHNFAESYASQSCFFKVNAMKKSTAAVWMYENQKICLQ